jgi:uncharacterized membrane protein YccF (DUF307 family)
MTLLLNILWLICGGFLSAFGWALAALLMTISVVGLPWVPAALRIALYNLLPFGNRVESTGEDSSLGLVGNVIWFILAGWWLALGHIALAVVLAMTIVGLPFAWAHLKLAMLTLAPVGTVIVPVSRP